MARRMRGSRKQGRRAGEHHASESRRPLPCRLDLASSSAAPLVVKGRCRLSKQRHAQVERNQEARLCLPHHRDHHQHLLPSKHLPLPSTPHSPLFDTPTDPLDTSLSPLQYSNSSPLRHLSPLTLHQHLVASTHLVAPPPPTQTNSPHHSITMTINIWMHGSSSSPIKKDNNNKSNSPNGKATSPRRSLPTDGRAGVGIYFEDDHYQHLNLSEQVLAPKTSNTHWAELYVGGKAGEGEVMMAGAHLYLSPLAGPHPSHGCRSFLGPRNQL